MLEEAIRLLFSHPRLAEMPEIAASGEDLLMMASSLALWRCLTEDATEPGNAVDCSAGASAAEGEGEGSSAVSMCSSLLRLISLALTVAKAVACCSGISELGLGVSFELWKMCLVAARRFKLPQRMQAAQGMAALLLNPVCRDIRQFLACETPREAALSVYVSSSLLVLLQGGSNSVPPRLAVDVLMAGQALLALFEQEAGKLPQLPAASSVSVGGSGRQRTAGDADFDGIATKTASYILTQVQSLACAVFGVPPLGSQRHASTFSRNMRQLWSTMASGCPERFNLQDGVLFFSTAFQNEAATATSELAAESIAALSNILSSPMWDRVLGYNSASDVTTCSAWLGHIAFSLCCAASILELHPAARRHGHMGSSTPGGGIMGIGSTDVALAATFLAPLPSVPVPVAASRVLSSSSQWQEARHSITEALRLLSDNTPASRAALVRVLSVALGLVREVFSGIVSGTVSAAGGDSLGTTSGSVAAVANQNRNFSCLRDWELVQSELLLGLPEELWGVRPCCNTACVRLEGPCEMEVKTQACGGGCGARYCCVACQEQAWRGGHRRNCAAMREMRERWDRANGPQLSVEQ